MPFNKYSSVENEQWTSNYNSCGIDRDCMNMSIFERNNLVQRYSKYTQNDRPKITNDKRIHQSQINRLNTAPYKNGKCLINRQTELSLQTGTNTMEKRSLNVLSEVSIDNSIPLIPLMIDNFHGHNNIYNFSNVGINTRNLESNKLYIKKCVNNINKINTEINT